ncbi:MAG TPA: hypothetical protein ENJ64_03835 [Thiotrichales bacterium]|nr:hypothetical protein [Thiotrichales bacterium]
MSKFEDDQSWIERGDKLFSRSVVVHGPVAIKSNLPINENRYSGSTPGSRITEGGLELYTYFQFQVIGASVTNTCNFAVGLDKINQVVIAVKNVATGAFIPAGTDITEDGIYALGYVANQDPIGMKVGSIKISHVLADAQLDVTLVAC